MVPFDSRSPFQTSGFRVGTSAITTRGLLEAEMDIIVEMIDKVISNIENPAAIEQVQKEVHALMSPRPIFAW